MVILGSIGTKVFKKDVLVYGFPLLEYGSPFLEYHNNGYKAQLDGRKNYLVLHAQTGNFGDRQGLSIPFE